jgi:hypothetical protein
VSAYSKLLILVTGMSLAYNDILWIFESYLHGFLHTVFSSDLFLLCILLMFVLVEAGRSSQPKNRCSCPEKAEEGDAS